MIQYKKYKWSPRVSLIRVRKGKYFFDLFADPSAKIPKSTQNLSQKGKQKPKQAEEEPQGIFNIVGKGILGRIFDLLAGPSSKKVPNNKDAEEQEVVEEKLKSIFDMHDS